MHWDTFTLYAASWLLTYLLHSSLLIGGTWLLVRVWNPAARRMRDLLWKAVLVGSLLTASLHVFAGIGLFSQPLGVRNKAVRTVAYEKQPVPQGTLQRYPGPLSASLSARQPDTPGGARWPIWVVMAWGIGAVIVGTWRGLRRWRFRRGLALRRAVRSSEAQKLLSRLQGQVGLRRRVRLTVSPALSSPVALGLREICLPERTLSDLKPVETEGMLAHELVHLARLDPVWLLVCEVLESIFFFQPLNVLARRRLQEAAEEICDARAARLTGQPEALARCLVEVATWSYGNVHLVPAATMASSGSRLNRRVRRLLDGDRSGPSRLSWAGAALGLGMLGFVACAGPGVTAGAQEERQARPPARRVVLATRIAPLPDSLRAASDSTHGRPAPPAGHGRRLQVRVRGDVSFADDPPRIESISPGGRLTIEEQQGKMHRRLVVTSEGGKLHYAYAVQGKPRPFGEEARRWMKQVIANLDPPPSIPPPPAIPAPPGTQQP